MAFGGRFSMGTARFLGVGQCLIPEVSGIVRLGRIPHVRLRDVIDAVFPGQWLT
jgi:hypothetical protein